MKTIKQNLNFLTASQYKILRLLCHTSKNLVNETLYIIKTRHKEGKPYIKEYALIKELKGSINGRILQSNMTQQIIKSVSYMYTTFFTLLKKKKLGELNKEIKEPNYLPKNGYYPLIIQDLPDSIKNKHTFTIPYARSFLKKHNPIEIRIPSILQSKDIREIRIVPKYNARIFEVHYAYNDSKDVISSNPNNLDKDSALAIDLGVNNLATCVDTCGNSFIIDGKKIKSYNQWYNKKISYLERIKSHQGYSVKYTKQQANITAKRNRRILDYLYKTSHHIVNYCILNNIGIIVMGYNDSLQRDVNLGHKTNQMFKQIPFGQLKDILERLCKESEINFITIDESYTSKASFLDNDPIPTWSDQKDIKYIFSGKRINRGRYMSSTGKEINADLNGALNILKKSNVVPDAIIRLYSRGELNTPIRIRLHK